MSQLTALNAISPIDGRYRNKTQNLAPYFSEEALIKYRVLVEIEYFIIDKFDQLKLSDYKEFIHNFIQTLNISDEIKAELLQISPSNYLGI
jgi:adenylosuccinate lyase